MEEKVEVLRQIYENLDEMGRKKMTSIMEGFSKTVKLPQQAKQHFGELNCNQINKGKCGG